MRRAYHILGILWLCALAIATPTSADVIFSNFGPGDSSDLTDGYGMNRASQGGGSFPRVAGSFTPSFTGSLDSLSLAANLLTGPEFSLNQLDVNLRADRAGTPGSIIESFRISNQMSEGASVVSATSTLHPTLAPGSRYWLEASVPSSPDPGFTAIVWRFNSTGDIGLVQNNRNGIADQITTSVEPAFRLSGTPAPAMPIAAPPGRGELLGTLDPSKPTVVLTHGWAPFEAFGSITPWVDQIKAAILRATGSAWNVVVWTWPEAFGNCGQVDISCARLSNETALGAVLSEGAQLARALSDGLGVGYKQSVHFIGHSFGTVLDTLALRSWASQPGSQLGDIHVTLLDTVSRGGIISVPADWYRLSLGNSVGWVDNYYSQAGSPDLSSADGLRRVVTGNFGTGVPIPGAANFAVGGTESVGPIVPHSDVPFVYLQAGLQYSRELGGFDTRPCPRVWLGPDPECSPFTLEPRVRATDFVLFDSGWVLSGHGELTTPTAILRDRSSSSISRLVHFDMDAAFLSFEFDFTNIGDGDYLSVFFDNELLFNFLGTAFSGTEFLDSGLIPISQLAGQDGTLWFILNGVGEPDAEVQLRALTIWTLEASRVPGPTSMEMMITGLMVIGLGLGRSWSRRHGANALAPLERDAS
jgi:hypothetical protein